MRKGGAGGGQVTGEGAEVIVITLPPPPSINHYYRSVGSKTLISKGGRDYRDTVAQMVGITLGRNQLPLLGRLAVQVTYCPTDRRRRDLDNILKPLLDALLKAGVYGDDEQIDELRIRRGPVVKGGKVEVIIDRMGGK